MIKRVAVVKFRMDSGCGDGTSCFFLGIEVSTDTTKCMNKRIAGFRLNPAILLFVHFVESAEVWSEKERCSSKIKPRLRAEEWCTL